MEPATFQEILHAVERHKIICPNPPFWSSFCTFINDEVPIDFLDLEWGPFILAIWHSTNDFEKNAQFKKQLKYLEAAQKEDLVTIFFGRSTPKFPVELIEEQGGVWYLNERPNDALDEGELSADQESLIEWQQINETVGKAARVLDLIVKELQREGNDYSHDEFSEDLKSLEQEQKALEGIVNSFKEKKLLEIHGIYRNQYFLNRGLDLDEFAYEVYQFWKDPEGYDSFY